MPRVSLLSTNFTAGELSPRMYGRVDVARYQNAAKTIKNGQVLLQGGAIRSPGSRFVKSTKTGSSVSKLIPFIFNRSQAYVLEFGNLYMRVYSNSGAQIEVSPGVPYEISTPYTSAQVLELDYTQAADTMLLWHPAQPTQRLLRVSDTFWALNNAPWNNAPVDEIGERVNQVATLSSNMFGPGRSLTVPASFFFAADANAPGRTISSGGGEGFITGFVSATEIIINITRAFPSTSLAANTWIINGSPLVTMTPSGTGPVGTDITLTASAAILSNARHQFSYVRMNGGLVQITNVTTTTTATARVLYALASTTAAPADAWSLEFQVWNNFDGHPRTGVFWEQRLIAAGTPRFPQSFWGSRTGLPFDFTRGLSDDDGFAFQLPSDENNPIAYMAAGRALTAFTLGGEFTIHGGIEKPITPTNIQIRMRSNRGTALVRPVRVGRELIFSELGGKRVRSLTFNVTNDDYAANDISILAEHMFQPGCVDLAWQRTPEPWLYAVQADGSVAICAYEAEVENVIAWTRRFTGSEDGTEGFESIVSIPDTTGNEQVWAIVRRVVNGVQQRYVERFVSSTRLDSAISLVNASPQTVWSGLSHLALKEVDVVADGNYVGRQTVTVAGQITLAKAAVIIEVGLPFKTRIELLTPELQLPDGSAQGNSMRIGEVSMRFIDTVGAVVNGQRMELRRLDTAILDSPVVGFTGIDRFSTLGWQRGDAELIIEQDQPFPFHLLSVVRKLTVNS